MRSSILKAGLIGSVVAGLIAPGFLMSSVEAQKQGAPLWYSVVSVNRVKKPDRKPPQNLHTTERKALLTLQWRVLQRGDGNVQEEVESSKDFQAGDQFKLAITTNQSGYLYIVNQPPGKDAVLLFPDLRINRGANLVVKDQEYMIPAYCPTFPNPKDCWLELSPPAGTETMIVIFSRERITTLPNRIAKPNSVVKRSLVEQLIASSEQRIEQMTGELQIPGKKAARYATRVQNTNPKDNEELIAKIELTHGG